MFDKGNCVCLHVWQQRVSIRAYLLKITLCDSLTDWNWHNNESAHKNWILIRIVVTLYVVKTDYTLTYLLTCLLACLPACLPAYLPTYLRTYLRSQLHDYASIYDEGCGLSQVLHIAIKLLLEGCFLRPRHSSLLVVSLTS